MKIRWADRTCHGQDIERSRRMVALFITLALFASACASNAAVEELTRPADTPTSSTTQAPTTVATTSSTTTTQPEPLINRREIVTLIRPPVPQPIDLTAAGGVRLELPEDSEVLHSQNCALLSRGRLDGGPETPPIVAIGTAEFLGGPENAVLTAISGVDEWFAGYEPAGAVTPEPTGETITVLDEELDGYRIEGAFTLGETVPDEVILNCAVDEDNVSEMTISAVGFSDVFVAEIERGILFVIATGLTREDADSARNLLDAVLPTIERSVESAPGEGPVDVTTASEPAEFREPATGPASFTAAGGLSVELPQPMAALHSQNCVVLLDATYTGRSEFEPAVAIGITGYLGRNSLTAFSTAQEWFAEYEIAGEPKPASTNETISFLGVELDGFRVEGAFIDGGPVEPATLSCATDGETLSDLQLFTAPFSDVFTAATDDGLLVVIANGFTEDEQLVARELLDAMLPTIESLSPANDEG